MKDFRDLKVWEKAHQLTLSIYQSTISFPRDEQYGLTSQIRRAAVSVPANIAEGCGKNGDAELSRYFQIAMGSASELEYELMLAHDLHYLDNNKFNELLVSLVEVRRMLNTFIQRLRANR